jgi:hypothetical protein
MQKARQWQNRRPCSENDSQAKRLSKDRLQLLQADSLFVNSQRQTSENIVEQHEVKVQHWRLTLKM